MKSLPFTREIWQAKLKVLQGPGEAQTRRLEAGLKEINLEPDRWRYTKDGLFLDRSDILFPLVERVTPRHHEGEIAYVPEAWCAGSPITLDGRELDGAIEPITAYPPVKGMKVVYKANWGEFDQPPWRSPRFMPAWAARWFVQFGPPVPQRVQEITFAGCLAEGIVGSEQWLEMSEGDNYKPPEPLHPEDLSNEEIEREISRGWEAYTRQAYSRMWDAAYPKHPFESNPWEMTYRFRLVPRPEGL